MKIPTYLTLLLFFMASTYADISVSVVGLSESPTSKGFPLQQNSSILDALARVGGLHGNTISNVTIKRVNGSSFVVDCVASLKSTPDGSFPLEDGDIVYISQSVLGVGDYDYFNRLLFEWAYLKAMGRKVDARWQAQAALMTSDGQKKK